MNLISTSDHSEIVEYLTTTISNRLESGESVLWLVPGGSAMGVATKVLESLVEVDSGSLCITLTDERYGNPGHEDENWTQLMQLGFAVESINAYRVLRGESPEDTARDFSAKLYELFNTYSYRIGLFGMGADGHTAGILPHTSGVDSDELAVYYVGDDYPRVTMTGEAIAQLDEAVLFAYGESKHEQVRRLLYEDIDAHEQPAKLLLDAGKFSVYTDYQDN